MQQDSVLENKTYAVEVQNITTKFEFLPSILLDITFDKEKMEIDRSKECLNNDNSKMKSIANLLSSIKFAIWIVNFFRKSFQG